MAKPSPKSKTTTTTARVIEESKKHKGVHAKSGTSLLKSSKKYKKQYRGQGRWPNLFYPRLFKEVKQVVVLNGLHTFSPRFNYLAVKDVWIILHQLSDASRNIFLMMFGVEF